MVHYDFVIFDPDALTVTVNFKVGLPLIIHQHDPNLSISHFSHGHGGQNLNKHQNGVRLLYTIPEVYRFNHEKEYILEVRCHEQRHQHQNFELAMKHLAEKLHEYFYILPPRIKSRTPSYVKKERLDEKKHRSRKKELRQPPEHEL